jgi:sugar O-acyltransferase (sialic acid O-acetyltransferase NeuD family)
VVKPVVIFGVTDMAQVAHAYFTHDSEYDVVAFTAHERYLPDDRRLFGRDIVPFERLSELYPPDQVSMFVCVGYSQMNQARATIYEACKALGYELVTYVNSKAVYWGDLDVGDNCFILENNVINPYVRIGNNVVMWSGNHIGHHSVIEDHCFITSHAVIAGRVTIKARCFIGINATIRDGVTVARECLIGASATILKDTVEQGVYAVKSVEPARLKTSQLRGTL